MIPQIFSETIKNNDGEIKLIKPFPKVVFWGVAPTGDIHIGYLPYIALLKKFKEEGAEIIIFIGDYHAYLDGEKVQYDHIESRSLYYKNTFLKLGFDNNDIITAKDIYTKSEYIETVFEFSNFLPYRELTSFADTTLKNKETGDYSFGDLLYVATQIIDVKFFNVDIVLCGLDESGIYRLGLPILEKLGFHTDFIYLGMVPGVLSTEMHASNDVENKITVHDEVSVINSKLSKSYTLLSSIRSYILPLFGYHEVNLSVEEVSKIIYRICNPLNC